MFAIFPKLLILAFGLFPYLRIFTMLILISCPASFAWNYSACCLSIIMLGFLLCLLCLRSFTYGLIHMSLGFSSGWGFVQNTGVHNRHHSWRVWGKTGGDAPSWGNLWLPWMPQLPTSTRKPCPSRWLLSTLSFPWCNCLVPRGRRGERGVRESSELGQPICMCWYLLHTAPPRAPGCLDITQQSWQWAFHW